MKRTALAVAAALLLAPAAAADHGWLPLVYADRPADTATTAD